MEPNEVYDEDFDLFDHDDDNDVISLLDDDWDDLDEPFIDNTDWDD